MHKDKDSINTDKDKNTPQHDHHCVCGGHCGCGHDHHAHHAHKHDNNSHANEANGDANNTNSQYTTQTDSDDVAVKIAELENNWKRALADYKNLEKRVAEERVEIVRYANQTVLLKMLTVLDNLELLAQHNPDESIKLIMKEFTQILTDEGVEKIQADGMDFDQNLMDAVEMVEVENKKEIGKVIKVGQNGYKLFGKVIRPAKVTVGSQKEEK